MTFLEHLLELRKRVQWAFGVFIAFSILSFFYSSPLIKFLLVPAPGVRWIFLGPGEYFIASLKVSLVSGFIIAFPFILYQLLVFISPGLTPAERWNLLPLALLGMFLFGGALVLDYLWVLPSALHFFLVSGLPGTEASLSIGPYLSFAVTLFFWTGLLLQVPLILVYLVRTRLVAVTMLQKYRPHAFLGSAVLAAVLTPGHNVFLMAGLAVLLHFFYELGIILASLTRGRS